MDDLEWRICGGFVEDMEDAWRINGGKKSLKNMASGGYGGYSYIFVL